MNKRDLNDISKIILSIGEAGFISAVNRYLETFAASANNGVDTDVLAYRHAEIHRESEAFLSLTAISMSQIFQLPIPLSLGNNGASGANGNKRSLVRKLKMQQMDLLASMSDEVEIITSMIQESGRFQCILHSHCGRIRNAEFHMQIIRDRLSNRPSPLQRIEVGEMTPQIEYHKWDTADPMDEITSGPDTGLETANTDPGEDPCRAVFDDANSDIRNRLQRMADTTNELKQGWKLLKKVVLKGCSRRTRRAVEQVVQRSEKRTSAFNRDIMESRLSRLPARNTMAI